MTGRQRLKRVFNSDIDVCEHCGGQVKLIANIEDPKVIERILTHLEQKAAKADAAKQHELPPKRAPPLAPSLFDPSQSRLFDKHLQSQHCKFSTRSAGAAYIQRTISQ